MAPMVSHLVDLGLIQAKAYGQKECFDAGVRFAKAEGIIPAPEATHAVKGVLETGANNDWRQLLKESVGSEMSAKPMLDYFAPLMAYLKEQNKGRTYTQNRRDALRPIHR